MIAIAIIAIVVVAGIVIAWPKTTTETVVPSESSGQGGTTLTTEIRGRVFSSDGGNLTPIKCGVALRDAERPQVIYKEATSNGQGFYEFKNVEPGTYTVTAWWSSSGEPERPYDCYTYTWYGGDQCWGRDSLEVSDEALVKGAIIEGPTIILQV